MGPEAFVSRAMAQAWAEENELTGFSVSEVRLPVPMPTGVVTQGGGQELVAYGKSSSFVGPGVSRHEEPSLRETVASAWDSWRQKQATLGNLEDAGQGPGDSLEAIPEDERQS